MVGKIIKEIEKHNNLHLLTQWFPRHFVQQCTKCMHKTVRKPLRKCARRKKQMKSIILLVLLFPGYLSACIIGPERIEASKDNGFEFNIEKSDYCQNCQTVSIIAPKQYEDINFSHGLFTLYDNNEVLSRTIHKSTNESGNPQFLGIVNGHPKLGYEITFEYGGGRCMKYMFIYRTDNAPNKRLWRQPCIKD